MPSETNRWTISLSHALVLLVNPSRATCSLCWLGVKPKESLAFHIVSISFLTYFGHGNSIKISVADPDLHGSAFKKSSRIWIQEEVHKMNTELEV